MESFLFPGIPRMRHAVLICACMTLLSHQACLADSLDDSDIATLRSFVAEALEANPSVRAATAEVDASAAMASAAARSFENPELSIEYEDAEARLRLIGVDQTLDIAGKRRARAVAAKERMVVAEAHLDRVRRAFLRQLLSDLAAHSGLVRRDALADARVGTMAQLTEFSRQRHAAGDVSLLELNLAVLASAEAGFYKADSLVQLAEVRERLRARVAPSQRESTWPVFGESLPALPRDAVNGYPLSDLPDVRVASARVRAAEAALRLMRRDRVPDPIIGLVAGREEGEDVFGVSLSVPIPILNSRSHEVTASSADLVVAQQELDRVRLQARARLGMALQRFSAVSTAWAAWRGVEQVDLESNAALLESLWSAGELGTAEYLVHLEEVLEVNSKALELLQKSWDAWFEYLAASGRIEMWLTLGTLQ